MLRIPDDLAARFASTNEIERRALEALALDAFRLGRLSRPELKRLLGFATGGELDAFRIEHGVAGRHGPDDLDRDRADLRRLGL